MSRKKIHLLYEHGANQRPFGSAYIRLIRPLTHPHLQEAVEVTQGLTYQGQAIDGVIVDRLWRPDISPAVAKALLKQVRAAGSRFIYALDDNFLALPAEKRDWEPTDERLESVRIFLAEADGLMVTTPALRDRFAEFNSKIVVVPNALDERLLPTRPTTHRQVKAGSNFLNLIRRFRPKRTIIGYMGTFTHDDDLMMILPALQTVAAGHKHELEFQLVGAVRQPSTLTALKQLPFRVYHHKLKRSEYPQFMAWFSGRVRWDIAIAPLKDTPFNRCKSDVKFLDYCAIGAAGIYSDVPAYQASVRHLETGWLAENNEAAWVEALKTLLADEPLRQQIAGQASHYLFAERVIECCSGHWLKAFDALFNS